jgi:ABC-type sugar transport system substrate-binding protein
LLILNIFLEGNMKRLIPMVFFASMALMVVMFFVGCNKRSGNRAENTLSKLDTTLHVGVSVRTFTNPYMVTIAEGGELFCKYLDSIGQKYEFEVMLNEGSNDEQINAINAFLAKSNGNAILFVDPNEAAVCSTIAQIVDDAGAYMCTTWNKPNDINVWDYENWIAHHSPDDVGMGYDIAVKMFSEFKTPYKGKILAVQGLLGNTTNTNRFGGLEKALKEYPEVELLATESARWSAADALKIVETWLSAYSDVDGIWCGNDNMAMGVIQALKARGLDGQVKVVGINAIPDAVQYIEEGIMTATVDCNGRGQGGYTLALDYQCCLGDLDIARLPQNRRLFGTEAILVTKDTVGEYKATYIDNDVEMNFTDPYGAFWYSEYPTPVVK